MRRTILDLHNFGRILALVLSLLPSSLHATEVYVSTIAELQSAINNASVGDTIILANGTYTNSSLTIDKNNIIVKAATPGGVILNGTQNIDITGSFITFSGFQFTSGDIGPDYLIEVSGNHNTLTQLNFNGYSAKKYIQIAAGTNYNEISYCNIENKPVSADIGCTIQINTSPTVPGYHKIRYCSFKNFPGPGGDYGNEPIRIGLSTEMTNISRTIVEYCYFNNVGLGDGESISVKSTENICRYNTFTNNPEGMLVLRHGYRNVVYGNFFINGSGGIRIKEGANHYVYNNYFATGTADAIKLQYVVEYPLANINFIHNTFVNCGAIDLGGTGPTLVTFANNIFKKNSGNIFTNPNQGTSWAGNIRNGNLGITISSGMTNADPLLAINSDGYYGLTSLSPAINTSSSSYPAILDIENIDDDASVMLDISGQFRPAPLTLKDVGCDEYTTGTITNRPLNISDVGPSYLGGPHSLTIVATAGANGSISPNGVVTVNFNTNQTFIVAPNAGYHVDSLIVDGINTDSTTSYTFVGVSASHTIHAVFKINQYIIASTSGTGGTILPSGSVVVNHGSNQNFEISPNEHYSVESVVVDGVSVDSSTSYTFTNITSGHSIHAIFAIDRFAITATVNSDGEITPSGTVLVAYGASQTFTMTPATGYHIDSVVVDGALTDSTTTFTFMNVNTNHTIKAFFGINTTVISVSEGWNLVSVPVIVYDKSKTALFPSAISSAYAFDPGAGYIPQDTLQNGVGYWLNFGAAENVGMTGIPIARDSVNVIAGWNIIGSISSPVSADSIIQIPSGIVASVYYAFLGTYTAEDTLVPGKAYWVKVNSNGVLVLR